eukprot:XP_014037128.1 PREDICTED: zinc finger homeobox protein 4-like [Salmo salar]
MATCDSPSMVVRQENGQKLLLLPTGPCDAEKTERDRTAVAAGMDPNSDTNHTAAAPEHIPVTPNNTTDTGSPLKTEQHSRIERFTGNGTVTGTGTVVLGSDHAHTAASLVAPVKEIPCNECSTSFSSLQQYMEHHCPNTRLPNAAGREEEEEEEGESEGEGKPDVVAEVYERDSEMEDELEDSDVENLCGEIVYQPDGSAFILEDSKEHRGGASQGLLSLKTFPPSPHNPTAATNNAHSGLTTHGGDRDQAELPATAPMSFCPQVINTFHIASSLGKAFPGDPAATSSFPNTSAFAGASGPVLHSFRVYDLRHKNDKDYLTVDGAAKNSCVSKDVPNNVDLSKFEGCVSDGQRKPVLMCFLCKLSFGYSRSFVTHAVHDHRMTLNEQEQKLLSNKHVSAIIQGIGKDKEPLISFLEPKKSTNSVLPHFSTAASFLGPDSGFHGLWNTFHAENADSLQAGFAFLKGSASSNPANQTPRIPPMPKAETNPNLGGVTGTSLRTPASSASLIHSSPTATVLERDSPESDCEGLPPCTLHPNRPGSDLNSYPLIKREPAAEGGQSPEEDMEDIYFNRGVEMEMEDDEPVGDSSSSKDFPILNQSISHLSNSVLKYSGNKGPLSFSSSSREEMEKNQLNSDLARDRDSSNDSSSEVLAGPDGSSPSSHLMMPRDEESPGPLHQHGGNPGTPGTPGTPGLGEGSPGSCIECPKCDTVLGSSRSLGGHMTMMHSRNSCKTLKCPKCNWHYKYQQTLDAHMKEKHPESGGSCVYCRTGQAHPRLARGESYTCGYKPFRCEVCNYSTTTKGNLSIHMQSDKHLNNVQTLQNGGTEPQYTHTHTHTHSHTLSPCHSHAKPVPSGSLVGGCGTPSPSKPKQKPMWRCEVCDYETNVARNLRIHMTSEKHMHNMMLLQQNMKQIQHGLHLGLAPAEAELYQYYLAQNIGLTGVKLENPSPDAQMIINPFQLDPNTAAALSSGLGENQVNNELSAELRLASGQLMADDLSVLSGESGGGGGELSPPISDPSLCIYQCSVCSRFTSDSLEVLGAHVNAERTLPEDEWRGIVGDVYQCKLCTYNTQLKANFQLHCKTDKHMQKHQLVAHIKEGGKANQWRLKCVAIGNPVHLKCNACDYYSNSVDKLRLHATNQRHEAAIRLYKVPFTSVMTSSTTVLVDTQKPSTHKPTQHHGGNKPRPL